MSDAAWALLDAGVALLAILAIAANCYRIHRRFKRQEKP